VQLQALTEVPDARAFRKIICAATGTVRSALCKGLVKGNATRALDKCLVAVPALVMLREASGPGEMHKIPA